MIYNEIVNLCIHSYTLKQKFVNDQIKYQFLRDNFHIRDNIFYRIQNHNRFQQQDVNVFCKIILKLNEKKLYS